MDNIRLTTKQGKDSFPQLLFLIDPLSKEINFSTRPVSFEPATGGVIPSFLKFAEDAEPGRILSRWEKALQLKPGQTLEFSCTVKVDETTAPVHSIIKALGIQLQNVAAQAVLFSVSPTIEQVPNWKEQYEQLVVRYEQYKNDYTEFIDIATHDLDAPLRKLMTFTDRLVQKINSGATNEEIRDYITRINASVTDMRTLIDSLSTLSQVNTAKTRNGAVSLESVVKKVMEEMNDTIRGKNAVIRVGKLPMVNGDTAQYERLFKNIIGNAIKFSKPDVAPVIEITKCAIGENEKSLFSLTDEGYYKIEISDNGIGFQQEFAEKIFRPFQRLHGKSQFPGNGIGLAVCKKIMDNHHGIIFAKGTENSGACFVLILPQTHN